MGQILSHPITSQLLQRRGHKDYSVASSEMQGYRLNMEDQHTIQFGLGKHENLSLFGVFDGHAGEKASLYLAANLHKKIAGLADPTDEKQLQKAVMELDLEFMSNEEARENGSTCCFCVVQPKGEGENKKWEITACNVGDSRAILIKKDGTFQALTEDHKPEDPREKQRIEEAGGSVSMNRVDGQLAMSRAIGDYQYKADPKLAQDKQKVIPLGEIQRAVASPGDYLLVCCDGIVEQMSNADAVDCVNKSMKSQDEEKADPATAIMELFKLSLAKGSKDNHSALLITFHDGRSYEREDEFVAGPYHPFKNDATFARTYKEDAAKHGISGEELEALARKTEASMPELKEIPTEKSDGSMQAIEAFLNQPGESTMREKLMMLTSMLQRGLPGEEDGDDEDEASSSPGEDELKTD